MKLISEQEEHKVRSNRNFIVWSRYALNRGHSFNRNLIAGEIGMIGGEVYVNKITYGKWKRFHQTTSQWIHISDSMVRGI